MGRKCNVLDCPSDSKRNEDNGVTFHKMPFHPDLRPKWIELCRIPEERQTNKVIYVCSRHFRRTDFCNFKGTKYMLKQGALPSVFPWTKHMIKSVDPSKEHALIASVDIKSEPVDDDAEQCTTEDDAAALPQIKTETNDDLCISTNDMIVDIKSESSIGGGGGEFVPEIKDSVGDSDAAVSINFLPGTRIEANDFNDKWYAASILEVDYEENEVFVEFDKHLNRANEWIPMDSSRLRPYVPRSDIETYNVGERCMATWIDTNNKFPATIRRVMEGDSYEVLFDDGFVKILKQHKLAKIKSTDKGHIHIAPLFDPVVGSKEERRERKRKINVAELFGIHKKKHKEDNSFKTADVHEDEKSVSHDIISTNTSGHCEGEEWTCRWLNGEPVGIESVLDNVEGSRRSIIVPDHRLPTGWEKHLTQRMYGSSAGKWDTVLVNADGKKFHNRQAVKLWLEENKLDYHIDRFDFCLHLNRARKLGLYEVTNTEPVVPTVVKTSSTKAASGTKSKGAAKAHKMAAKSNSSVSVDAVDEDTDNAGALKIIMENNSYKCPIQGCGKNFRKENLAQMHIKHYHPEYTKFIGSTPNVADLAYARTVGEHIDDIIVPKQKPINNVEKEKTVKVEISPKQKSVLKVLPPKEAKQKTEEVNNAPANVEKVFTPGSKDSEIIRLLNSEPKTKNLEQDLPTVRVPDSDGLLHNGAQSMEPVAPAVKYPEIKLTDLLHKAEPLPVKKDEPPRTGGIKTLLPVIRSVQEIIVQEPEKDVADSVTSPVTKLFGKSKLCRKRQLSENELYKEDELSDYGDGENKSRDSFGDKSLELPPAAVPVGESPEIIIEGGEVIRLVHMRSEEIINCTCGITEEDGLMIQCELCLCWQHAHCNNIEKENEVPEKYICKICKNPERMRASMRYCHDQEWLKQGKLATSTYHARNEQSLTDKFEKLRKTHELSGCLIELMEFIHNLKIKLNIADIKDHPKLYLWANAWHKTKEFKHLLKPESDKNLIECMDVDVKSVLNNKSTSCAKDLKIETQSELISILEDNDLETDDLKDEIPDNVSAKSEVNSVCTDNKADILSSMENDMELSAKQGNISGFSSLAQLNELSSMHATVPQPEAPINSTDCRMHLLDHVSYFQSLVEQRLDLIEADIKDLEECDYTTEPDETTDMYSETKQPLQMLIRDLTTMRAIAVLNK